MVRDNFFYYVCRNCRKKYLGYCPEKCEKCNSESLAVSLGDWAWARGNAHAPDKPKLWDIED